MQTFDATVDFENVAELTRELARYVVDGEFTVAVVPADDVGAGFLYTGDEDLPEGGSEDDWVVTGKTAAELAEKLSDCLK